MSGWRRRARPRGATRFGSRPTWRGRGRLEARRAPRPSLSRLEPLTILEDATVPRSRLAEMVGADRGDRAAPRLVIGTFGHAGDGNLHPTRVLDPTTATRSSAPPGVRRDLRRGDRAGRDDHRRARRRPGQAPVPRGPLWAGAGRRSCGGSRPRSTRRESSTRGSWAPSGGLFTPELLDRCISCGFCLPGLPDLRADRQRALVPARADQPDAGRRDRPAARRRPGLRGGVLVLPGLPCVRAGVPGRRALRRAAGGVARHAWRGRTGRRLRALLWAADRRWRVRALGLLRRHAREGGRGRAAAPARLLRADAVPGREPGRAASSPTPP